MSPSFAVTGGAGFIGSQMVRTLLSQGARTGHGHRQFDDRTREKFGRSLRKGRFSSHRYSGLREDARCVPRTDFVVHLAAIPSVPRFVIEDPEPCHDVNVNGTFNVYRAALEAGVRRLVFAASSAAYGDTEVLPKKRDDAAASEIALCREKRCWARIYASVFADLLWVADGLSSVSLTCTVPARIRRVCTQVYSRFSCAASVRSTSYHLR